MSEAIAFLPEVAGAPRPAAWDSLRADAEARLSGQGYPAPKAEDWKYTDLSPLKALCPRLTPHACVDIRGHILPESRGARLVFVNGHYDPHYSNTSGLPAGVRMLSLASASEAAACLGSLATPESSDAFTNLNTARFQDGAFIYVPKGMRVEPVLHVCFMTDPRQDGHTCSLPRLLVVLERGADLHLVEEYSGQGSYLTNTVVEVVVREDAELRHERIQLESHDAVHLSHVRARVGRSGRYLSRTISFGARLSRQTPHVVLAEEGAEAHLDGLALLGGDQVADTHSIIDHTRPHGTSRQHHKAIADGQSRVVFNGKIFVRPGAQQTDAQQQSRNLLLSEKATVDTKPELQILADDVKCAHGAAIGQLDPEELFYLQSRGLDPNTARNLLTYGFAADLLARIPVPHLRKALRQMVMERTGTQV
nr:Fe-S cluster assembly protein SufD [uncultured Holophaga sp.]